MKKRLDKLILEKKILKTRERAKAYIICGNITVDGEKIRKPAALVSENSDIRVHLSNKGYVSRGGIKLEGALEHFNIDVKGAFCLDIGASTGGFTDCLIKKGARHVIALDVGKNQIDYKLRTDARVTLIERYNARYIDHLNLEDHLDIVTIDVSFISLKPIVKPLLHIIDESANVFALIKPQFELERPYRGFRGVVNDRSLHIRIIQNLNDYFFTVGYIVKGYIRSPLRGPKGNIEYFAFLKKRDNDFENQVATWNRVIEEVVNRSYD